MKYDFHIHSKYSNDGWMDIDKIIKSSHRKGLGGIAITDHNTIKGGLKAKKYESDDFKIIVGSEIMTKYGEITGLFLTEEIKSQSPYEVIDEIKSQDGLVIIPHPCDAMRKSTLKHENEFLKRIDHVEIYNSRCIYSKYNKNAEKLSKKYNLKKIAGSDAHFINEIGNAGIETNSDNIRKVLKKGCFDIYGFRSIIINHGLTKVLKLWRKTKSGFSY
ncbi:PHP domain-containing protein [Methanobacterium movens]